MDHDGLEAVVGFNGTGDRFCQWTGQETHDFLAIRGELDPAFMETRRNKVLWEMVSTRMAEIGYQRNPQQCKSKWKNLVTRYKGCETMETAGEIRQEDYAFPFYNDLQIIFNARMQRMIWLGQQQQGATNSQHQVSSNDEEGDGGREDESQKKKKKKRRETGESSRSVIDGFKSVMEEYMKQQMEMETQWMKAYEEREERRRVREREWRETMEALESERVMMMRWWREREEQRKVREEARANRRDALITALLEKLRREG